MPLMLITDAIRHTKPYIVTHVGRAKFIYSNSRNILLIVCQLITVCRNGKLLGQLSRDTRVYTKCDNYCSSCTMWSNDFICGIQTDVPHNIPFFYQKEYVSIFGFNVVQYVYDSCRRYQVFGDLYEKVI